MSAIAFKMLKSHKFIALVAIGFTYWMARIPEPSAAERKEVVKPFAFERTVLNEGKFDPDGLPFRKSLKPFRGYLAAFVPTGVAFFDLENAGLSRDLCLSDSHENRVQIMPAPGTGERYAKFELNLKSLSDFDPATVVPTGCLPGDFNEDGRSDLLVYFWGRPPVAFLRKPGNGIEFATQNVVNTTERWYTSSITQADVTGTGHLDLIVANYYAEDAKIFEMNDGSPGGDERVFESFNVATNGGRDRLLMWKGNGQYEDVKNAFPREVLQRFTLVVAAGDLSGDQLPEIFFGNDNSPNFLLFNESTKGKPAFRVVKGQRTFRTPASKTVGNDVFHSMGVDFADLNSSGKIDMFVANITAEYALHESHFAFIHNGKNELFAKGLAPFDDMSEPMGLSRTGWAWDVKVGDFNNDGSQELINAVGLLRGKTNRIPEAHEMTMGNDMFLQYPSTWHRFEPGDELAGQRENAFFARSKSGKYVDIGKDLNLNEPGVTRGVATADVQGDGKLDFAVSNQWAPSSYFTNRSETGNYLGLHVRVPYGKAGSNSIGVSQGHPVKAFGSRPAIGAQVTVELPDGKKMTALVDGGNGLSGKRSTDVHFGLGNLPKDTPVNVTVAWRDSQGESHRSSIELTGGWHTLNLGAPQTVSLKEVSHE